MTRVGVPGPARMPTAEVVELFETIASSIGAHDSFEGSIQYSASDESGVFEVTGAFRVGNSEGQGGMILVGSHEPAPRLPTAPKRVFIASPLRGDIVANQAYAREALKDSLARGEAPFVPHLLYDQVLDDRVEEERAQAIKAALAMLAGCEMLALYVDKGVSLGMAGEQAMAIGLGIPVEERRLPTREVTPGLETDAGTIRYRVTERGPHAVAIAVFLEAEWRRDYEPAGKSRLDMHNDFVVNAMFAQGAL